jgi:demethylmenaquinone methyltransferase / 2-methoxy-6-polyprenyl-1,4-benzoquinol methylase
VNDRDTAPGTRPPGAENEAQAAAWVRQMFANVAPKYDFLNHLLSLNIDRSWRRRLLERVQPVLGRPGARTLDLCCGTGDVLLELRQTEPALVFGADFCHPMLIEAGRKITKHGFVPQLFESDALQMPLRAESVDLVTIAFGFRNLANYNAGFTELFRILKPRGMLAILEFSHPRGIFLSTSYGVYSKFLLPLVGAAVSGSSQAYTYLPESIKKFPRAEQLAAMMRDAGFYEVSYELLTGGIAALHIGRK